MNGSYLVVFTKTTYSLLESYNIFHLIYIEQREIFRVNHIYVGMLAKGNEHSALFFSENTD